MSSSLKVPGGTPNMPPDSTSNQDQGVVVQLSSVVELMTDPYFIANWKTFYKLLDEPHPNFLQVEKWFAAGFKTFPEILSEIVGYWVIAHWGESTVGKLQDILLKGNFRNVARDLEDKFSLDATIIMTKSKLSTQITVEKDDDEDDSI